MQPPEDAVALRLSLIPGEVVESQTIARCIRRRSKASVVSGSVVSMRSPTPACWALCLQGGGVSFPVKAVTGDSDDVFFGGKFQWFFFAGTIITACCAPVGPHVSIPEKKWDWTLSLTWRGSEQWSCHSNSSWWRSRWVWIQPPSLCQTIHPAWSGVGPSLRIKVSLVEFASKTS